MNKSYFRGWMTAWLLLASSSISAFSLMDAQGKSHSLQPYQGKWVVVNFWATWCPPCIDEIPELSKLQEAHPNDVVVLGVAVEYTNRKQVAEFADTLFMSYPLVFGGENEADRQFGKMRLLPATLIYAPNGELAARKVGPVTRIEIERFIESRKR